MIPNVDGMKIDRGDLIDFDKIMDPLWNDIELDVFYDEEECQEENDKIMSLDRYISTSKRVSILDLIRDDDHAA